MAVAGPSWTLYFASYGLLAVFSGFCRTCLEVLLVPGEGPKFGLQKAIWYGSGQRLEKLCPQMCPRPLKSSGLLPSESGRTQSRHHHSSGRKTLIEDRRNTHSHLTAIANAYNFRPLYRLITH